MFAGLCVAWDFAPTTEKDADACREAPQVAPRRRALQPQSQSSSPVRAPAAAPHTEPPVRKPLLATRLVPSTAAAHVCQPAGSDSRSTAGETGAQGWARQDVVGGGESSLSKEEAEVRVGVSKEAEPLWRSGVSGPHLWSNHTSPALFRIKSQFRRAK